MESTTRSWIIFKVKTESIGELKTYVVRIYDGLLILVQPHRNLNSTKQNKRTIYARVVGIKLSF